MMDDIVLNATRNGLFYFILFIFLSGLVVGNFRIDYITNEQQKRFFLKICGLQSIEAPKLDVEGSGQVRGAK